ncbi:HNH endonuclease [Aphanizomenon sp. PH219]|uniref:HNH endonuclease n=1 Tax=Aphanizomenon flos-aquae TaxID=1176 RepID=UPI00048564F1|nr:HNH endonuclease [Aphanizomenon flos-aquae]MDK2409855.1 HNH endonuclease [Aphanizomenon sp. 202]MDK2458841.1 HNH endonuclease [Aphanizomenon sp. PH219]
MFKSHEELRVRASELKSCFYCSSPLPGSKGGEHIFNASWGGSHKTNRLICNNCNDSFSKIVDTAFKPYTDIVMNAYSFKGERHKSIPNIQLEGSYFLDAGGKPKLKKPLVQEETLPDGRIKSNIFFTSRTEGKRWLEGSDAESWLGRPLKEEEKEYLRKKIIEAPYQSEYLQPQDASAKLDLRSQYRSAAHTVLKCLGFFIPECVCDNQTKQIRQFARYNESDWLLFAVHAEQHLSLGDQVVNLLGLGVKHNSVEIYWCSYLRMVIGVVTILNRVKRSVVIAKDYSGPDKILYVFEDTNLSGKAPRAISVEINPQKFSLPIIGIQYFAYPTRTYEFFQNELSSFANTYYPIDCLTAKLIRTIDEVNQTSVEVDENLLEKYRQAFIEYFINLNKVQGESIHLDKLLAKMSDYGFATLADKFIGKNCNDIDFNSSISKIFESLMNEFTQGYFL